MRRFFVCLISLLSACSALGAEAKTVKVGEVEIVTLPSAGHCLMDEEKPADARLLQPLSKIIEGGGNRLLAQFADCNQLDAWRTKSGKLLDDFVQYQVLKTFIDKPLPVSRAEMLKLTCASLRKEGEKYTAEILPDVRARAAVHLKAIKLNEMKFLGVVAEDSETCYASMLQKLTTELKTEKTQLCIFSVNIVRGKLVYFYAFSPFTEGSDAAAMLKRHQRDTTAFQAANR